MEIRDPLWLAKVLDQCAQFEGKRLSCFGTSYSPEDFVHFEVHTDHLSIELHRILPGVASFDFQFLLRPSLDGVVVQRVVAHVEGSNKRIRRALGEPYAKTSIGIPFCDLTAEEEEWVQIALTAFHEGWMQGQ